MQYSHLSFSEKFFGIGANNFKNLDIPANKLNYFESFFIEDDNSEDDIFSWKTLGYKSLAFISSALLPIFFPSLCLFKSVYKLVKGEFKEFARLLFAILLTTVVFSTATPFIMLANLIDLIGSLIHTLSDACTATPASTLP